MGVSILDKRKIDIDTFPKQEGNLIIAKDGEGADLYIDYDQNAYPREGEKLVRIKLSGGEGGASKFKDLDDVHLTAPTVGQTVTYDGSKWVNSDASAASLAGLSDVTLTAPQAGQVLIFNGTKWINKDDVEYTEGNGIDIDTDNVITAVPNENKGIEVDANGIAANIASDLKFDSGAITHNNVVTAHSTEKLMAAAYDAQGHVTSSTDLDVDRGLNITDNKIGHTNEVTEQTDKKPVNVAIDKQGHITDYEDTEFVDLADVNVVDPANHQFVKYFNNKFVNATPVDNVLSMQNNAGQIVPRLATDKGLEKVDTATAKGIGVKLDPNGGISVSSAGIAHSNVIDSKDTESLCKVAYDANGHVVSSTSAVISDIKDVVFTDLEDGHLLSFDGTNWVNVEAPEGAVIDTSMSDISTNAVQNKVIKEYVDERALPTFEADKILTNNGLEASWRPLLSSTNPGLTDYNGLAVKPNTNAGIDVDANGVAVKIADDSISLSSDGIMVQSDGLTIETASGVGLRVPAQGISTLHIVDRAVTIDKISTDLPGDALAINDNGLSVKIESDKGLAITDNGLKAVPGNAVYIDDKINVLTKLNGGILADGSGLYVDRTVVLEPLFMSQAEYDARTDKDSIWAIITD